MGTPEVFSVLFTILSKKSQEEIGIEFGIESAFAVWREKPKTVKAKRN
jgi:hypothetical protein